MTPVRSLSRARPHPPTERLTLAALDVLLRRLSEGTEATTSYLRRCISMRPATFRFIAPALVSRIAKTSGPVLIAIAFLACSPAASEPAHRGLTPTAPAAQYTSRTSPATPVAPPRVGTAVDIATVVPARTAPASTVRPLTTAASIPAGLRIGAICRDGTRTTFAHEHELS